MQQGGGMKFAARFVTGDTVSFFAKLKFCAVFLLLSAVCLFSGCGKGAAPAGFSPEGGGRNDADSKNSNISSASNDKSSGSGDSNESSNNNSAIEIIRKDTGNEGNIPEGSVFQAVINGDKEKVKIMLKEKPELVNRKNPSDYGRTPLHYAVIFDRDGLTDLLISAGADVNLQDNEFQRPPLSYAAISGNCEIAKKLLAAGAKADLDAFNGWTPLHEAAMEGRAEMIRLLLSSGANIAIDDETGKTPLHYAAMYGRQAAVKVLLEKGADIGARDNEKKTPLHLGVLYGDKDTVGMLLENDADFNAKDSEKHTAAFYAKENGKDDIYDMLLRAGAKAENVPADPQKTALNPGKGSTKTEQAKRDFKAVIISGDKNATEHLFSQKKNINKKDDEGLSPLHIAVMHGNIEAAEMLINKGAIINAPDNYGRTPLHYAAIYIKPDMADLLLRNGADTNIRDKEGKSALCMGYSGSRDNGDIIKALVKSGCRISGKDNNGWTPLHWAAFYGKEEAVKLLLVLGADPLSKNSSGQTPLDMLKSDSIPQPWLYGEIRDILFMAEEKKRKGK